MDDAYFSQRLDEFQERVDRLLRQEIVQLAGQNPILRQALEELQSLLEELYVARAELRENNEEILSTRNAVEVEQQRYRDLFEFAPDGYLVTDENGKILEANRVACLLSNVPADFLTHKFLPMYVAVEDRAGFRQRMASLVSQAKGGGAKQPESWEVRLHPRHAEPIWVSLTVAAYQPKDARSASGITLRWIIHDIRKRKQTLQELQAARDELERRVAERTEQLTQVNARLTDTAGQLTSINQELSEFTSIASHDLQEPLRKVQAFGKRLQERLGPHLDEENAEMLDRMVAAAAHMQSMVTSVLDYARASTHSEPFCQVSLDQVANQALADLELSIERSGGRVELGDLPTVDGDANQLHQLLLNLIGNGLKFHRPGVPPTVKLWGESLGQGQVRLLVQDNGIGIEAQYAQKLFQPFTRLHGKSEYDGNGIGLAICRKIAERHGGTIEFQSAPGQGTTFIVTLPQTKSSP